jgi:hypothetical protein
MLFVLMAVNALSVVWFLFRNMYGVKGYGLRLPPAPLPVGTPSWTPPLGLGVVLGLVTLAFACGLVAVWALRPLHSSDATLRPVTTRKPVAPGQIADLPRAR